MVIKKSNAILVAVATAVVFYFIGAFFPLSFIYSDLVAGDIGKAKTYRSASSEDINAAMELLASSKDVQQSTITASLILSNRVMEMDSLAKASLKATEGIAELAGLHKEFEAICTRTANALDAFTRYNQEMSKVIEGKTSKTYEQYANNAYIAFSMLESRLHNSGPMIDEIAAYLQKNQNRELDALACAWIEFGAEDAFLSGSEKDYDKWKAAYANLSGATGTPAMPFPAPETVAASLALDIIYIRNFVVLDNGEPGGGSSIRIRNNEQLVMNKAEWAGESGLNAISTMNPAEALTGKVAGVTINSINDFEVVQELFTREINARLPIVVPYSDIMEPCKNMILGNNGPLVITDGDIWNDK